MSHRAWLTVIVGAAIPLLVTVVAVVGLTRGVWLLTTTWRSVSRFSMMSLAVVSCILRATLSVI